MNLDIGMGKNIYAACWVYEHFVYDSQMCQNADVVVPSNVNVLSSLSSTDNEWILAKQGLIKVS